MKRRAGAGNLALLCLSLINSSPVTGRKKPPRLTTAAAPKDLTTFRSAKDENNEQERAARAARLAFCVPLDPYPSSFEVPDLVVTSPHVCSGSAELHRSLLVFLDSTRTPSVVCGVRPCLHGWTKMKLSRRVSHTAGTSYKFFFINLRVAQ